MQISSNLILDKIAPTKQLTHLVKAKSLTRPRSMGRGFGRRTSDAKVRIQRERVFREFWDFCQSVGISFLVRMGVYLQGQEVARVFRFNLGLISQFIMINLLIKHKGNKWMVIESISQLNWGSKVGKDREGRKLKGMAGHVMFQG